MGTHGNSELVDLWIVGVQQAGPDRAAAGGRARSLTGRGPGPSCLEY
ncbi:hypothetical protein LC55x_4211 [Lysobacter capsici]|uniref:Uncharacterized protein n=1 Tax=Lysobacter capsici AZ78 TaxID=1444315 RepID=A0A108UCP3_9GAMM|nr:hypothetical protein LC55x_4211 [Lysobacter capsici]KWS06763.1 hypothetical protein AZ78_4321 [Lysobacter capsici AZ78]